MFKTNRSINLNDEILNAMSDKISIRIDEVITKKTELAKKHLSTIPMCPHSVTSSKRYLNAIYGTNAFEQKEKREGIESYSTNQLKKEIQRRKKVAKARGGYYK